MPQVPVLRPAEVVKTFTHLEWEVARQKESHIILTKKGHIATLSIPKHPTVAKGTLRSLLSRAGITIEEFLNAKERCSYKHTMHHST